jgi:alcohol dehydrogenase YqhD (iron-dependent ADH family)
MARHLPLFIRHGLDSADKTINKFEEIFKQLECPVKLEEAGIGKEKKQQILDTMILNKVSGMNHKLSNDDLSALLELMMN